jgi:hypothetical protein
VTGLRTSIKNQARITEDKQDWKTIDLYLLPSVVAAFLVIPRKELLMMKNYLKFTVVLGIVLSICVPAQGMAFKFTHTPEIDPSLAISAITLLAGSLAVLRARRNK